MSRRETTGRRRRVTSTRPALSMGPVALLSLALLLVGWSLLWLLARHEAAKAFSGWLDAERAEGRLWTCPDQRIAGYPLKIVISCNGPTFKGALANGVFEGDMAGLRAEALLYFPTNVVVTLASPIQAHELDGDRRLRVTWATATLTLRGALPGNLDRGMLEADGIAFGEADPASGSTNRIGHVEIGFKPVDRSSDARGDLEANATVEDAALPFLDRVVGSHDPISLKLRGFATQVAFDGAATLASILDPWYRAGGQVHVQSFTLRKGPFLAEGAGRIGLDADHRVDGRLDTRFSGLDPIAARLGIPVGAIKIGGVLAGLLGGGKPTESEGSDADMALPLVLKEGRLFVGPVRTGIVLTPLY